MQRSPVRINPSFILSCPVLQAERIILHPGFNATQATSDLAIVVVNKLQYTEYVQPICVWGPVYDKTALFGEQAVVSFWAIFTK